MAEMNIALHLYFDQTFTSDSTFEILAYNTLEIADSLVISYNSFDKGYIRIVIDLNYLTC